MALVNYMGNAPGFMSYNRQRAKSPLGMVDPYKPAQQAPPLKELGDDFDGNPGDKQWLYDRNEAFNSGLTSLYNEYGGEMDWVTTDPRYKQLVAADRNFVKNQEAAIQNKQNTTKRKDILNSMGSGQADSDYELTYVNGAWIPKKAFIGEDGEVDFSTKGDYLQDVVWKPQEVQHEDGSGGIGHTQFDYGTGNENDFNALVGAFLTDTGDHSWARSNTQSSSINNDIVNAGRSELHKRASSGSSNWEQINDATDYLVQYGFDTNHEYFIAQEMVRDFKKKQSFKIPKTDESGNVVYNKKTNRPELENYRMTEEDLSSPDRMKFLTQFYVQDRVEKYAKKYLQTDSKSETVDDLALDNINPATGLPIEDPSKRRWQAITANEGPKGPGFTETFTEYGYNKDGVMVATETTGEVYNKSNLPQGMDQAESAIVGQTLGKVAPDGRVKIGGMWTTIPQKYRDELTMTDLKDVRRVKGEKGQGDQWVARTFVIVDEDAAVLEDIKWYDATAKTAKKGLTYSTFDISSQEDAALNQGIMREVSDSEIETKGWTKSQMSDVGWDISTESNDIGFWMDVPVNNQIITWDQQAVGEGRAKEGEQIEVGGRANEVNRQRDQNSAQRRAGANAAVFE